MHVEFNHSNIVTGVQLMKRFILMYRNLFFGLPMGRVKIGRNVVIRRGSELKFNGVAHIGDKNSITARGGRIVFGERFASNEDVIINADIGGSIVFGDDCLIGPRVIFRTANHAFSNTKSTIASQGHTFGDIVVEDDVWIGANTVVLPGVRIGEGSVVGAGSVVTRDIAPFSVAAGVPARKIRER